MPLLCHSLSWQFMKTHRKCSNPKAKPKLSGCTSLTGTEVPSICLPIHEHMFAGQFTYLISPRQKIADRLQMLFAISVKNAEYQRHSIFCLLCEAKLMHWGCRVAGSRLTAYALLAGGWHQPYCLASGAVWSAQSLHHSGLCCWPWRAGSWSPWSLFQPPPPPLLLRCQSQCPSPC